jgi:biopolymer transport protein TolQ
MLQAILNTSPVILIVLGLLIAFSVVSWTIIVFKSRQINRSKRATKGFLDFFWETREFDSINNQIDAHLQSPIAMVFREGYSETKHFLDLGESTKGAGLSTELSAIDNISRALRKVSAIEIEKLEKDLPFLATTGSTTPFIGLFGTVWGIMSSFQSIGEAGSTSLAIVAPGISEALLTTAIGLAVAIPAVIGFNYLQNRIRVLIGEIDNFSYDYLNIVQRIFNAKK